MPAAPWKSRNAIVDQFLEWLDGGLDPPTALSDSTETSALLLGAIEASETDQTVDVAAKVQSVLGPS